MLVALSRFQSIARQKRIEMDSPLVENLLHYRPFKSFGFLTSTHTYLICILLLDATVNLD